jgi:hypothetical protein
MTAAGVAMIILLLEHPLTISTDAGVAILTLRPRRLSVRKQIHHKGTKAQRPESSCLRAFVVNLLAD